MMQLLCFLGFHKWYYHYLGVTAAANDPTGREVIYGTKVCERCGKLKGFPVNRP